MKKYDYKVAILIGYIVSGTLVFILPNMPLSDILSVFIVILGGFIATYLSRINNAIIGLYEGILYSVSCLPIILISSKLTFFSILILVLIPVMGFFGGYIAKILILHLENEE